MVNSVQYQYTVEVTAGACSAKWLIPTSRPARRVLGVGMGMAGGIGACAGTCP